ncbi:uncharacterized protein B0H18DRAFT_952347 [Fomitopsis serialis]|uniref:uncharacterized protein n=1 Tax=Fomitopsis serialis TaxID=139415 RepID=UPI0020080C12|nr:uncharacterized protein B0H18DRAFT_952347 [Neoantrodia serialis]KAH9932192.1 hypothetical protein B0H18DRAFT_952347 [Neoantrodia serialis]
MKFASALLSFSPAFCWPRGRHRYASGSSEKRFPVTQSTSEVERYWHDIGYATDTQQLFTYYQAFHHLQYFANVILTDMYAVARADEASEKFNLDKRCGASETSALGIRCVTAYGIGDDEDLEARANLDVEERAFLRNMFDSQNLAP